MGFQACVNIFSDPPEDKFIKEIKLISIQPSELARILCDKEDQLFHGEYLVTDAIYKDICKYLEYHEALKDGNWFIHCENIMS